ncbi:hypothetical protein [Rhabdaerophilum sp. SD176]|uniref:hypothetical protein n=1 Tax=Rhabdaerophilum sp. SD176 TaxID=2983548 RepID=UPI0024DF37CF|nr:hypothetical protein [Rhabdaerophilum sp. SD176]
MSETPPGHVDSLDEATILSRFAPDEADAAGLVAYALHRRALLAFRTEFTRRTGAAPSGEAEQAFLISETSPARLSAYRAEASRLLGPAPTKPSDPAPRRRTRWMAVFGGPPMLMPDQPDKVNWRGLLYRLGMLLLAVIATSLLLRVLFVRPL